MKDQWFNYFWTCPEAGVPEDLWFGLFSGTHLATLAILALAIVAAVWGYCRLRPERRHVMRLSLGIAVLVMEVGRQVAYLLLGYYTWDILPLHLCAVATFCCFIDALKPNTWTRAYLYALGTWGPICALAFADWTDQPIFNIYTFQAFLIHGCLVTYAFMIVISGESVPQVRDLWKAAVIMVVFVSASLMANAAWDTNFWFLNTGSPGSPLQPIQDLAGPFYIPVLVVLLGIIWCAMYLPWCRPRRRHLPNAGQ